jgi:hypothetical protein
MKCTTKQYGMVTLVGMTAVVLTGCVTVKPITQTNITQSWFDEEEVVGAGIPIDHPTSLKGKKVFLNVHTAIPEDEKIIRDVKFDPKEKKGVPNHIPVVGGIRKAVEDRIRSRLTRSGVEFVQASEQADFKVDVEISKAGLDVLKCGGEMDINYTAGSTGKSQVKGVSFLSIQTTVNGKSSSYYNTTDFEKNREGGGGGGFPTTSISISQNGVSLLGERKICSYASSYRFSNTYAVLINIPKTEGLFKIGIYSPRGEETEVSINAPEMNLHDQAHAAAAGDLQKLGESVKKMRNSRLEKFLKYEHVFTTGSGLLIVLMHDYINQLETMLR